MKHSISLLAALFISSAASAHEVTVGTMQIIHANIPAPASNAQSAAGYMGISNNGSEADTLIGVEAPIAGKSMLHTTEFGADGIARMIHVPALEIPADDTVVLEPGGYHIMLMGLQASVAVGDMVPATLIFEHAGRVEIEFMVDPADGSVDHSKMDHGAMNHGAMNHGAMGGEAMAETSAEDLAAIDAALRSALETDGAQMTVAPVSVADDVAIAGWTQGETSGRAFLRRDAAGWFVELFAGRSLMLPTTLQSLGVSKTVASDLLERTDAAEAALGADVRAKLDRFEGTALIGRKAN